MDKRLTEHEKRIYKLLREKDLIPAKWALKAVKNGRKFFDKNRKIIGIIN